MKQGLNMFVSYFSFSPILFLKFAKRLYGLNIVDFLQICPFEDFFQSSLFPTSKGINVEDK